MKRWHFEKCLSLALAIYDPLIGCSWPVTRQ
jgi:hypothetical protein